MFKRLFFVTAIGFLLVAGGCSQHRTVLTVSAEATAYEQAPFYQAGANARVTYRLESMPVSTDRSIK